MLKKFAGALLLSIAASSLYATDASAQTYVYTYQATEANMLAGTLGTFTISKSGNSYALDSFSGKIGFGSYSTADVGLYSYTNGMIGIGGNADGPSEMTGYSRDFKLNNLSFSNETRTVFIPYVQGFGMRSVQVTMTSTVTAPQIVPESAVAAVPEPASWALMIGGFSVVGAAARRRRGQRVKVWFA